MRLPRRYIVLVEGKPLIVIRAYSKRQARELIAARLADTSRVTVTAAPKDAQR